MSTTAIFRTPGVRAIEARFAANSEPPLMERAGAAVAATASAMLGTDRQPILVVAGPGNNGGDGFVAARRLKEQGLAVVVVFFGAADHLPPDARDALRAWQSIGGRVLADIPRQDFALAVDALFGIGLTRPVEGQPAAAIEHINALPCPILAVDIPSGLCADTGRVLGIAVRATRTISFIAGKPGLFTLDGPDHCGEILVDALGLALGTPEGRLIGTDLFRHCLRPRRRNSHKGGFGSVGVIGGAPGMAGAALLAGRAALKLGAGRVYVGLLERLPVDPMQPELMLRAADDAQSLATVLAIGPGLGQSGAAFALLRRATESTLPLVLDADALNLLAAHPTLFKHLARRVAATLLTPHPAEAARLLDVATDAVQADRVAAALELARRGQALVVLKGCGSVVATPAGHWYINATGNPGLASAGTGDVLTGCIAALLAQGWPTSEALLAAVHLHGAAADTLAAAGTGPVGLTAGELIDTARALLNRWLAHA
jgi:ADP-dependent NAD(P)H-hydrate dehydratase / NAD(P)H-hydrate epimerase